MRVRIKPNLREKRVSVPDGSLTRKLLIAGEKSFIEKSCISFSKRLQLNASQVSTYYNQTRPTFVQ